MKRFEMISEETFRATYFSIMARQSILLDLQNVESMERSTPRCIYGKGKKKVLKFPIK